MQPSMQEARGQWVPQPQRELAACSCALHIQLVLLPLLVICVSLFKVFLGGALSGCDEQQRQSSCKQHALGIALRPPWDNPARARNPQVRPSPMFGILHCSKSGCDVDGFF